MTEQVTPSTVSGATVFFNSIQEMEAACADLEKEIFDSKLDKMKLELEVFQLRELLQIYKDFHK
jgi:hypothetical protein